MASRVKVTISINEKLLRELSGAGRKAGRPRSRLVEDALRLWRRQQLAEALKKGYQAMAEADRSMAERNLRAAAVDGR
jgi:metal-responsive CopG/Arc/MetJ family transcriptional regulator